MPQPHRTSPLVLAALMALTPLLAACISDGGTAPPASAPAAGAATPAAHQPSPVAVAAASSPPAAAAAPSPSAGAAATAAQLALRFDAGRGYRDVETLARPEYMGRHAGTPGEQLGADYLAEEFRKAGLRPAGDNGTYLQRFPMQVTEMTAVPRLTLTPPGGAPLALELRQHFRPLAGGAAGPGTAGGTGFFGGYAEGLTAEQVQGRVVIVVAARRSLRDILTELREKGAAGVIATTGSQPMLKGELSAPEGQTLPVALLSRTGFDEIMRAEGRDPEALRTVVRDNGTVEPFALRGTVRLEVATETRQIQAINALGMLPGAPGDDVYVVGAHYEEIGPDPDGVVFPAANDNASGTAVMLELARLLGGAPRPKASVIFAGWSGHEEGLLGSEHFLNNPPVPLERIKGYLNLDTVGNGSGSLSAGAEDGLLRRLLDESVEDLKAAGAPVTVNFPGRREGGSDHVNFQRRNIPAAAFAWSGLFPGGLIHVPEDGAKNVDPEKLQTTGRVAGLLLLKLAAP